MMAKVKPWQLKQLPHLNNISREERKKWVRVLYISHSVNHSLTHSFARSHCDTHTYTLRTVYVYTKIILLMPKPNETTFRVIYRWAHQIHWFMNMAENVFFFSLPLPPFGSLQNIAITAANKTETDSDWMTRADKYDDIISEWKKTHWK